MPPSAVQPSLNVGEYHASAMTFEAWRSLSLEQRAIQPLGNITLPLSSALEPAPSSTLTYVPCTSPKQFKTSAYNNGFVVGDLNLPVGANYLGARPKSAAVVSGAGPPPLPAVNHLDESGFKRSETVNYQKKNVDEAELIRKERNLIILKNITRFDINLNVYMFPLYIHTYILYFNVIIMQYCRVVNSCRKL